MMLLLFLLSLLLTWQGSHGFVIVGSTLRRPTNSQVLPSAVPPRRSIAKMSSNDGSSCTLQQFQVAIEYCTGCRWGLRSFWMAQELLTTFQDDVALQAVTLRPSQPTSPGGIFVIQCYNCNNDSSSPVVLWDRKEQGGFPEIKDLKQRVRDQIDPALYLGHSDRVDRQGEKARAVMEATKQTERDDQISTTVASLQGARSPSVAITYCTGCRWLLRAAYLGQELMTTFENEISSLSLIPSRPPTKGGQFTIALDGQVIWDRAEMSGFPGVPELKQLVRDRLVPSKDLGHSDLKKNEVENSSSRTSKKDSPLDEMDDEEAEEGRKFFGVL